MLISFRWERGCIMLDANVCRECMKDEGCEVVQDNDFEMEGVVFCIKEGQWFGDVVLPESCHRKLEHLLQC
jgi:hypothetical protein